MGLFFWGWSFFCGWFFSLLEDPVRKLHEYHGTASLLHTGTKEDGTTEDAHKMIGQISYKKKLSCSLRRFPLFENVNERYNEMRATTVSKLIRMLVAECATTLPAP